jgi:hypothetical protein
MGSAETNLQKEWLNPGLDSHRFSARILAQPVQREARAAPREARVTSLAGSGHGQCQDTRAFRASEAGNPAMDTCQGRLDIGVLLMIQ